MEEECFLEKTNLDKCKEMLMSYLEYPVNDFSTNPLISRTVYTKNNRVIELDKHPCSLKRIIKEKKQAIESVKEYWEFAEILKYKTEQIKFMENTMKYVSRKDFTLYWKSIWDRNMSEKTFKYWQKVQKEYLMKPQEMEQYSKLEDTITVYKALSGVDDKRRIQDVSWDLSPEIIKNRVKVYNADMYKDRPYIYKAKIDKKDIFKCCTCCNTYDLELDYTKLYDLELAEEIVFPDQEQWLIDRIIIAAKRDIDKLMSVNLSTSRCVVAYSSKKNETLKQKLLTMNDEERKAELKEDYRSIQSQILKVRNLKKKVLSKKKKAMDYLIDRSFENSRFEKVAFTECTYYIASIYKNYLESIEEALYLSYVELSNNELQCSKYNILL